MKNIKIIILNILAVFLLSSCSESLDINTNPLVATSADPNAVLPYVFVQYSNRHVTELGTRTMDVPQHMAFCFNSPRAGNTTSFLTGNTWAMYYNQVLGNLQLVEQDAEVAGASSNNINAIAKIFKAKSFFELSSIWEDVPFSEALDGAAFPSPKFDKQQDIFAGCVSILDQAMQLIDQIPAESSADVSAGDLIYGGDMDKWRRWANSLKIRILMMSRNNDPSVDSQLLAALQEPVIESNDQAALIRYKDTPAEANAWQRLIEAFFGGTAESSGVYSPGPVLYNLLSGKGDPREGLFLFDPGSNGPPDLGTATFGAPGTNTHISNAVVRNDLPHIMFLPAEIDFYKAELAMAGISSGDVQTNFNNGLRNIIKFWGGDIPGATSVVADEDIEAYISSLGAPTMQSIHEQLYLESFMRPIIAWNTVRRTGVPTLDPVPGTTISTFLKRFNYPPDEIASNVNTPANLPTDTPHWFEN